MVKFTSRVTGYLHVASSLPSTVAEEVADVLAEFRLTLPVDPYDHCSALQRRSAPGFNSFYQKESLMGAAPANFYVA